MQYQMNRNRRRERLIDIGFWVALPLMMLTMNDQRKWARVTSFILSIFPLSPLVLISVPIWVLFIIVFVYEEI